MMTSKQISLVKHSWKLLRNVDPILLGDVFYSKLFHDAPQIKGMFTTSRDEQSRKLIDMINVIVARLDHLDTMTEEITRLAQRHVRYGARPIHYQAVGNALLWSLQQGLGKDWNDEVNDAWASCYTLISRTMQESLLE